MLFRSERLNGAFHVFPEREWVDQKGAFLDIYRDDDVAITMIRQKLAIPGRDRKPTLGIEVDVVDAPVHPNLDQTTRS